VTITEPRCWICGELATTGEHKTKRSDLRSGVGTPVQEKPFYFHDAGRINQPIRSLNAKILKLEKVLCAPCNGTLTQPHDRAWARMSEWLRVRHPMVRAGDVVRANRIFRFDTHRRMLHVHLFFAKLFGCLIQESAGKIPIDQAPFADAIRSGGRPHPSLYLQFGCAPKGTTGRSNVEALKNNATGECVFAMWFYQIDGLTANVIYAAGSERWQGMGRVWHPRLHTSRLVMADFDSTKAMQKDTAAPEA
jgi:hypothetical protein